MGICLSASPGTADPSCPMVQTPVAPLPGCCRANGTCGGSAAQIGLGCVDPTAVGGAPGGPCGGDAAPPQDVRADNTPADTNNTDTGNTDTGNTDTGNTDTGNTDTGNTDTGNTDTGNTDTGNTDTGNTDGSADAPADGTADSAG